MLTVQKILAAIVALVCGVLLLRLLLGGARRQRFDAAVRRWPQALAGLWRRPKVRRAAAREAEAAIRRAREGTAREGNVYRPKSFRDKRKLY